MIPLHFQIIILLFFVLSPTINAVNINTANIEELARELSLIGPVKARRIIEYREKIGKFITVEQLLEVKGIGPKTLERNRDKIEIITIARPTKSKQNDLDLSPPIIKKQSNQTYKWFWDAVLIIPLFGLSLFIFGVVWFRNTSKDTQVLRKHLISTIFVCTGCGKISNFKNVRYEGFLTVQSVDTDLPPGWVCIPNWLGKPCDYCFDCVSSFNRVV